MNQFSAVSVPRWRSFPGRGVAYWFTVGVLSILLAQLCGTNAGAFPAIALGPPERLSLAVQDGGRGHQTERWQEGVDDSEGASNAEPDLQGEPTSTPRPTRTPTPGRGYDEVEGLPTMVMTEVEGAGDAGGQPPVATLSPTVRPTATLAPTIGQEGMVASVIGPDGGTLENPEGALVEIPGGALSREATLSIQPVANTKLPASVSVDVILDTAFDIALAGEDGRAITSLSSDAIIRIQVGADQLRDGARIYRVVGNGYEEVQPSTIDGTSVVARTRAFSRFVVGVPASTEASGRNFLPFMLIAGVVLLAMIAFGAILTGLRPRRVRSVGVRRTPPRSRYR